MDPGPYSRLDQISTRWAVVNDPLQFMLRYGPAIQKYLSALIKNPHDVEEVLQEFLLRGLQRGFVRTDSLRGRFRDYLKSAVRNAALTHYRHKLPALHGDMTALHLAAPEEEPAAADEEWAVQWRQCMLGRVWQALDQHQRQSPGNLFFTVLRVSCDHPEEDSKALAARVSTVTGKPLKPDAFRKQVSRARRQFAELLVAEVEQTLEEPTPEGVEEELVDVGLMDYVRDFLPADWRSRGQLSDPE
jgi:RNA polymerase sigma-70 factor (ECF subfamily)